jgi:hypothetical protein
MLAAPDVSTHVRLPRPGEWRIVWRGRTWHESDLRGRHLSTLALLTGGEDSWAALDLSAPPDETLAGGWVDVVDANDPRRGFVRLMNVLLAFLTVEYEQGDGQGSAQAVAEVAEASAEEIVGSLRFE